MLSPPLAGEKLRWLMRWLSLKECVTEESAIQVTLVVLAASGLWTKNVSPYPTAVGAPEIAGRGPRKR
jgi:hypothetical protein